MAAIKYKYPVVNEADIPAEHKPLYVKRGEFFVLDADGAEDAARLAEFRETNRSFMALIGAKDPAEARAKLEKLKDVDPDRYAEMMQKHEKDEAERLKKEGKQEEAYKTALEKQKSTYEAELKKRDDAIASKDRILEEVMIDNEVAKFAPAKGAQDTALPDITTRARSVFKLKEGKVIALTPDGTPRLNGKGEPLTIGDWYDELATEAAHLFKSSSGSGAGGHKEKGGTGGTDQNPWIPGKGFNRTRQAQLMRENPTLASRFKAQAGVK